jgi:hypothetical protein
METGAGTSMATKHFGTKLALACGSFLTFAVLTAFVGAHERDAGTQTGSTAIAAGGVVAPDDLGGAISVPADQQSPTPVARSRGS